MCDLVLKWRRWKRRRWIRGMHDKLDVIGSFMNILDESERFKRLTEGDGDIPLINKLETHPEFPRCLKQLLSTPYLCHALRYLSYYGSMEKITHEDIAPLILQYLTQNDVIVLMRAKSRRMSVICDLVRHALHVWVSADINPIFAIETCNKINSIRIDSRHRLNNRLIDELSQLNLQSLDLTGSNDPWVGKYVTRIMLQCRTLRELNLSSSRINLDHLKAERWIGRLETLHLTNTFVYDSQLMNPALLSNLTLLNLSRTPITDIGLRYVAKKCERLRQLDVGHCSITDYGVECLAKWSPHLEHVNCTWCTMLTNSGIRILAEKCHKLKSIDLSGSWVNTTGILALFLYCDLLEKLNLSSTRISDRTITAILNHCEDLLYIDISYTMVTTQGFNRLSKVKGLTVIREGMSNFLELMELMQTQM